MVEDLAPAASNPSFGRSVLPWRLNAGPFWFESGGHQEGNDLAVEDGIVVQNSVAIWSRLGKGFAELLHDPICRRMLRDVEMQDPAALVLDDDQQYKSRNVAVGTVKKSKATIASRWLCRNASHFFPASPRR
jgi:hypothetical protein